jgi:hypothetical protein
MKYSRFIAQEPTPDDDQYLYLAASPGDTLHWNGAIGGFELNKNDKLDLKRQARSDLPQTCKQDVKYPKFIAQEPPEPTDEVWHFAPPDFLGKFYILDSPKFQIGDKTIKVKSGRSNKGTI